MSESKIPGVTVLGAGAWGTALACAAVRAGCETVLWGRDIDLMTHMRVMGENRTYLPGVTLPAGVTATAAWAGEDTAPGLILLAVPSRAVRETVARIAGTEIYAGVPVIVCAKGIEPDTGDLMSEIIAATLSGTPVGALSGPSFARDVVRGLPTAVTVAANNATDAAQWAAALSSVTLRCYASDDLKGVQLGGALKNVLAIAAGIVAGREMGASAQAALITRGLSEIRRIGEALGGKSATFTGLSGLGDLVLTCSSPESRNFSYGMAVGRGEPLEGLRLAEGVHTAGIAAKLADDHKIDAPIISTVSAVLDMRLSVDDAIKALLARPLRSES